MWTRWVVLAASLVVALTLHASGRGSPEIRFGDESIDTMIADFMRLHDVAGVSLAIVQAPYITRATGHGVADRQRRTLVAVDTMFDIGEMRNAFTAVAAMQLVEEGKLELQAVLPLIRQPREAGRLEALVEQTSGVSYQEYVRARQFEPLGLKHTFFGSELGSVQHERVGPDQRHQRFLREPALINPTEPATGEGATSAPDPRAIYASASDISVWDIGLAGSILVKDAALRKLLYEPAVDESGTLTPSSGPWFFPGRPGLMITTGSRSGFSSLLSRFTHKDELLCVTLLANREGLDLSQLARKIAGAYNRKLGPPAGDARIQQSPYSAAATISRLKRALTGAGIEFTQPEPARLQTELGAATAYLEDGQVWVAFAGPRASSQAISEQERLRRLSAIDAALLEAVKAEVP